MYDLRLLEELYLFDNNELKTICLIIRSINSYINQRKKILGGLKLDYEDKYDEIKNFKIKLIDTYNNKIIDKLSKLTELSANDIDSNASDIVILYKQYSKISEQCPELIEITNITIYKYISLYTMNIIEQILEETNQYIKISRSLNHINGITRFLIPYIKNEVNIISQPNDKKRLLICFDNDIHILYNIISINTPTNKFDKIIDKIPKYEYERFITIYLKNTLYSKVKQFINNKYINIEKIINIYNNCEKISKFIDQNVWNVLKQPAYRIIQIIESDESDIQNIFETMICGCLNPESYEQIKKIVQIVLAKRNIKIELTDIIINQNDKDIYDETDWKQQFMRTILLDIYRTLI